MVVAPHLSGPWACSINGSSKHDMLRFSSAEMSLPFFPRSRVTTTVGLLLLLLADTKHLHLRPAHTCWHSCVSTATVVETGKATAGTRTRCSLRSHARWGAPPAQSLRCAH